MNRFINNFVEEYKAISNMKKSHVTLDKPKKKDVVIIVFVLIGLMIAIGFITNTTKNLGYVVNACNSIVLGSFILYFYSNEKMYQSKYRLEYNTWVSISYDLVKIGMLVIGTSLLTQLMLMRLALNVVFTVLYGVLFVLLLGVNRTYKMRLGEDIKYLRVFNVLFFMMYVYLLFFVFHYFYRFDSVIATLVSSYLSTCIVFMIRYLIKDVVSKLANNITIFVYVFLLFIYFLMATKFVGELMFETHLTYYYNFIMSGEVQMYSSMQSTTFMILIMVLLLYFGYPYGGEENDFYDISK